MTHDGIDMCWPTRIWIGHIQHPEPDETTSRPAAIADLERTAHDTSRELTWEHTIEQWRPGRHCGMRYGPGITRIIAVLDSTNRPEEHPESGGIILHDPRTGAANVALPGLPWGRPVTIPAVHGRAAIIPGWLGWSVAPLHPPHTMTLWVGHAAPTPQPLPG